MRKATSGMTLLEVLIALAIFAITALAVMKTTGQQVRGFSYLEQKTFAGLVAENQLTQIILEYAWPELGWHMGKSEQAGTTWHWRWRGLQTTSEQLRALEIEVSEQPHFKHPIYSLQTYVTKP